MATTVIKTKLYSEILYKNDFLHRIPLKIVDHGDDVVDER